jgi:hypothetical protein
VALQPAELAFGASQRDWWHQRVLLPRLLHALAAAVMEVSTRGWQEDHAV